MTDSRILVNNVLLNATTLSLTLAPEQLAEVFAEMDNHQMLIFFQHAVHTLNKHRPYAACDQFCAVVNGSDIDDDTVTALYHLQRVSSLPKLQSYKPRI